jgi:long-chain acyl-CoA synthetase
MIIPNYLERNAKHYPDKTAIRVIGDRSCTFSELKERAYRLANGLIKIGINKGDRVAVLAENCFEYPEMYFGIAKAGGVITPLNYRFAPQDVSLLTNEAGAKAFIVQSNYATLVKSLQPELKTVKQYICIGETTDGMSNYDELLTTSSAHHPDIKVEMEDLFCLMHTGGTTGIPKLTMLTHRNLVNCALVWLMETGITYGDAFLVISPLFHPGANWPLFFTFILGNTFLILKRFDIEEMLKVIEKEKVTASMWMSQFIPSIIAPMW